METGSATATLARYAVVLIVGLPQVALAGNAVDEAVSELVEILCGHTSRGRRARTRASVLEMLNEWLAVHVLQVVPVPGRARGGAA